MSFLLTTVFDEEHDSIEYNNKTYNLDMAFDNILLMFQMFDDKSLLEVEKIDIALEMLIKEYDELEFDDIEEMISFFKFIMKEFLDIELDKEDENADPESNEGEQNESPVKYMDYSKDAPIIYASFISIYGMDLTEQQGKLHWKKFDALLKHIDDKSKFKQVIGYRAAKIPTGKHVDKEHVAHLRRMKRIYSLDDNSGNPEAMRKNLDSFAKVLKAKAEAAKKNKNKR